MATPHPDGTPRDQSPAAAAPPPQPDASWRRALEASGAGSWTWDARTDVSTWDDAFLALYEIPPDAPRRADTWLERLHPEDRARLAARIERLRATPGDDRWSEVFRRVWPDGRVRWHQGIGLAYRDAAGALTAMAGIVLDITARKEAEEAVREREAQLDLIVQHYPGMVARLDRHLRYVYASPRYEEWFGAPASAVLGRTMADLIGPQAFRVAEPFATRALAGERVTFENEIVVPAGRRWWVQVTFVPAWEAGGTVAGLYVFATDITERKQAEAIIAESRAHEIFLLRLGDALRAVTDPAAVQETATRLLGEHLAVNRVHYAEVDGDHFVIRCAYATGVEPLAGRYPIERLGGAPLDAAQQSATVTVNDVDTDTRLSDVERARMRAAHIGAGVRLTLVRDGRVVAGVGVNQIAPRAWTRGEVALIEQVTERIFYEGERLRGEHATRREARRDAFLLQLSDALRQATTPVDIQAAASRRLGELLGVHRVLYAEAADGHEAVVVADWTQGVPSLVGSPLLPLPEDILATAREGTTLLVVDDAATEPALDAAARATWHTAHVAAAVSIRLARDRRWVGAFAAHSATPRHWTPWEVQIIRDTAERTWLAVHRVRAEQALEAAQQALRDRLERSELLSRISAELLQRVDDRWTTIDSAGRGAMGLLGADAFLACTFDAASEHVAIRASAGVGPEDARQVEHLVDRAGVETGAVTGWPEPATAASGPVPASHVAVARALGLRAYAAHPLRAGARTVGMVAFGSRTRMAFTAEDVALMRTLAHMFASILERARMATRLEASEARYRGLAEQIQDGIFVIDASGHLVDANQAGCDLFGYTLAELRACTVQDLLADGKVKASLQFAPFGSDELVRNEWPFRRKDGSRFIGEFIGRRLVDGKSQGVVRDITARKTAESAIERLEGLHRDDGETLRALLASAAEGILSVGEDGIIRSANPALAAMLGWTPEELVGHSYDVLILPAKRARHHEAHARYWTAPLARPMGNGLDLQAVRKDGTTVPVEISLAPIETSQGRVAFAFVTDISDRRRAERERTAHLRELEHRAGALRRLASQLTLADQDARERLAKVIHDHLQQVLFSARLRHHRLTARFDGEQNPGAELLQQLGGDLEDAIVTTRALVAELYPPMLHTSGLAAALAWLQDWAHTKYGLTVDLTADPDANPEGRDVRTLVFESVRELVFNAVKHAKVDRLAIDLSLTAGGDVRLSVVDGGAGFDPDDLLAIGRTRGTGFGLLAIRERLASLGGWLDIDAAPGRGARFTLTVPRGKALPAEPIPDDARRGHAPEPAGPASARSGRVLRIVLADDHALVRDGLRRLLADHPGIQVVGEASDGVEAVALVSDLRPDVVIMDVAMPHMDGVEATRRIHAAFPRTVVLGLSTEERPDGLHAIEDAGAAGYFAKGDDTHRLLERLLALQALVAGTRPREASGNP